MEKLIERSHVKSNILSGGRFDCWSHSGVVIMSLWNGETHKHLVVWQIKKNMALKTHALSAQVYIKNTHNTRPHDAIRVHNFLPQRAVNVFERPSYSPDFAPTSFGFYNAKKRWRTFVDVKPSNNMWCQRFHLFQIKPLLIVSSRFMNVAESVLWWGLRDGAVCFFYLFWIKRAISSEAPIAAHLNYFEGCYKLFIWIFLFLCFLLLFT